MQVSGELKGRRNVQSNNPVEIHDSESTATGADISFSRGRKEEEEFEVLMYQERKKKSDNLNNSWLKT